MTRTRSWPQTAERSNSRDDTRGWKL